MTARNPVRWGTLSLIFSVPALFSASSLVAGCSSNSPNPTPAPINVPAVASTPTSEVSGGQRQLAETPQACELLSSKDRSDLGVTSTGSPVSLGGRQGCDWTVPSSFGITVTMQADVTPPSAVAPSLKNARAFTIGSHQARELLDRRSDGVCAIVLDGGTRKSAVQVVHIDVSNTNFRDSPLACRRATAVAKLIEPKLS